MESYRGVDAPSLRLDFLRFSSDYMIRYYNIQKDIIRKYCSDGMLITTNSTGVSANEIKYDELYRGADVYSHDFYPPMNCPDKTGTSFAHAHARGIKDDGKFWVLETYCGAGHGNWARSGIAQGHPGVYRNNVLHAYASGAQLITLFKLHAFKSGYEQLGSCLIDLDRVPRRRYYEFAKTGELLEKLSPILDSTYVKSDAAIVFDYESLWSTEIKPISKEFSYVDSLMSYFGILRSFGLNVDVVTKSCDISKYKLLILPCLTVCEKDFSEKLKNFTACGGKILATYLTSSKDECCNGSEEHMPIGLCHLFGMRVGEVSYIDAEAEKAKISFCNKEFKNRIWNESLELSTAQPYGVFADSFRKGSCVISKNSFDRGTAHYSGTDFDSDGKKELFSQIITDAGIESYDIETKYGVEIIRRSNENEVYYFIFNNNETEIELDLKKAAKDILSGKEISGRITLEPLGFCVVKIL